MAVSVIELMVQTLSFDANSWDEKAYALMDRHLAE
jgi:hypothetical protein